MPNELTPSRSTKDTVEDWEERIILAEEYKTDYGESEKWAVYRDYYRGRFPEMSDPLAVGALPYGLTYEFGQVLIPGIYPGNPAIFVSNRRPGFEIVAKMVESLDNWFLQELKLKAEARACILDTYQTGRGIMKLGYAKGMPWAKRVDPDMFLVPFGIRTLEEAEWVDHIVLRPTDRVKRDEIYKNTRDLKGTHTARIDLMKNKSEFLKRMMREKGKQGEYTELHEIRNLLTGEILTIVFGYEKYIRGPEADKLQIEGPPYVDICFNDDPEYYWCPSDVSHLEPQQLEINETRTQTARHRRVALVKWLVKEGVIKKDEVDKLVSSNVLPVVFFEGNVSEENIRLVTPSIPQDLGLWAREVRDDARELMGIGRVQAGQQTSGRKTATEIERVQEGHDRRMGSKRGKVADFIQGIVRGLNQIVFTFWDEQQTIQIMGVDGAKYWVQLRGEDIKGEYDLKVDVESLMPESKEKRKREILQMVQALGNNQNINMDYLLRLFVSEFEWIDLMQLLPHGPGGQNPQSAGAFQQSQGKMMGNPQERNARASANITGLPVRQLQEQLG